MSSFTPTPRSRTCTTRAPSSRSCCSSARSSSKTSRRRSRSRRRTPSSQGRASRCRRVTSSRKACSSPSRCRPRWCRGRRLSSPLCARARPPCSRSTTADPSSRSSSSSRCCSTCSMPTSSCSSSASSSSTSTAPSTSSTRRCASNRTLSFLRRGVARRRAERRADGRSGASPPSGALAPAPGARRPRDAGALSHRDGRLSRGARRATPIGRRARKAREGCGLGAEGGGTTLPAVALVDVACACTCDSCRARCMHVDCGCTCACAALRGIALRARARVRCAGRVRWPRSCTGDAVASCPLQARDRPPGPVRAPISAPCPCHPGRSRSWMRWRYRLVSALVCLCL
mmetsp:Transcript_36016/g.94812  ORF Transcript_36016/g.94812 Transcript_36016/m.94812 type:complete len:344 (-) Transcript_36016:46-1077(-)